MMRKIAIEPKELIKRAESALAQSYLRIDETALSNQRKVLSAFRQHRLTEEYFAEKTGYGLHDAARDTIDAIYATVFGAEAAAVRMQFVSGTHAIAASLFGCLKPGERMASLTGKPYDSLLDVIGIGTKREPGSLKDLSVDYLEGFIDPQAMSDAEIDARVRELVAPPTTVAHIQKSCGYSFERRTFGNEDIRRLAQSVKRNNPDCAVFVDNCYGEFVETVEPVGVGADLMAGSLIKNPGGGLAISGAYVAGRRQLVDKALNRLTAPGLGGHYGLTYNQNRPLLQGFFLAPSVVANAVKGAMLFAHVLGQLGFKVKPSADEARYDIIQAIEFGTADRLIAFCKAIQMWSPVNAHVTPEPSEMPGYPDPVIMAAGTFIEGSTIELSADGPLRPPFAAFLQGGLTYLHVKCVLEEALSLAASGELSFI
ncbi:MAG TPA: methionine gamma-lyase family protein [Planktothrix sp.]|jgi:cystathionine beta-lyase family protein involved in aluminum resistance